MLRSYQAELGIVADALQICRFEAGENIITEGDSGDSLYIMSEGTAAATKAGLIDPDGSPKVLMEYEKGEWFGELALISRQPRKASILALSPTVEVLELPRSTFETFVGR
eukprot:SAG31_NODE_1925_length_6893_cov_3.984987_2_plen_110_part_00